MFSKKATSHPVSRQTSILLIPRTSPLRGKMGHKRLTFLNSNPRRMFNRRIRGAVRVSDRSEPRPFCRAIPPIPLANLPK